MKLPRKFVGKKIGEIDSHDFCVALIKAHKKLNAPGIVSVMTCEEGQGPFVCVHTNKGAFLIESYSTWSAKYVWDEFIDVITRNQEGGKR